MTTSPASPDLAAFLPPLFASLRPHVLRKNFPVLALLLEAKPVHAALAAHPVLAAMAARRAGAHALPSPGCWEAMAFQEEEIEQAGEALAALTYTNPDLARLVADRLRPSMAYQGHHALDDAGLLAEAWANAANGINYIVAVYAMGWNGNYPQIDSASYDPASAGYQAMMRTALAAISARARPAPALFFEPSLAFALALLGLNRRDEAGRFEPLTEGENKAAFTRLQGIDWSEFPYAALIVHGVGEGTPGAAMSKATIANCATVAQMYREGLAPVIVPTGGACHPKQTPFHEAVEIKRELILAHGIAEEAILIDPHARHTTTNLRNPARLLAEAGAPWGKPCLSVSIRQQIDLIASDDFQNFCVQILGYRPGTLGERRNDNSIEIVLGQECLRVDPTDPLDP